MNDFESSQEERRLSKALTDLQQKFDALKQDYDNLEIDLYHAKANMEAQRDQLNANNYELFHQTAYVEELHQWIKSDSVYTLLRYGSKSPSSSGVDDCEYDHYSDLYNLSTQLREADRADTENRNDAFQQQLP